MSFPANPRNADMSAPGCGSIQEAIREAGRLTALPKGWNSYRAEPISPEAARRATGFLTGALSEIPHLIAPTVVPTVRGGIQLEWRRQNVDVEIEFRADGPASWCAEDRETGKTEEAGVARHASVIHRWLRRVSDG